MSSNDPLDNLQSFYDSLRDFPTPEVTALRPSPWGWIKVGIAPLAAALAAYLFLVYCGSMEVNPIPNFLPSPSERYAVQELRAETPSFPDFHALAPSRRRFV